MTIQIVFQRGSERTAIRIIGKNVLFVDLQTNMISPIEGLKFNKQGVIKEHPDLKDDPDWKQKAIQRFVRSEEHTSELQSHSFISYAVFCLKKKKISHKISCKLLKIK